MRKILEVLQEGDGSIRFNTDVDLTKHPEELFDLIVHTTFSMATRLWGGNENTVLAIIRALVTADLSLCVNRLEILTMLGENSKMLALSFEETKREMNKTGMRIITFPPGIMPSGLKN